MFELSNACFQGSNVISGSARGLVVNTGTRTYFGSISERLIEKRPLTSFDKGVKSFTCLMIRFMVIMVLLVFMIVGMTKGNWIEALLFELSVAAGLTQNKELLDILDNANNINDLLFNNNAFALSNWRILKKSSTCYLGERTCFDCIAIKLKE
ncbi:MAG TPA: hypothetical protein PK348_06445 [Spirochaetota bacterium]|nr:hypothetical protein [Spirochaetota bacterium]